MLRYQIPKPPTGENPMSTPNPLKEVAAVEAKALTLRAKAVAWIAANPGKVFTIVAAVAAVVLWKLL